MTALTNDDSPVYVKLRQHIAAAVLRGDYRAGDQLPSVRALAAEYGANPLTVAKAYQRFQDDGYIEVRRGVGMLCCPARPRSCARSNARILSSKCGRGCARRSICSGSKRPNSWVASRRPPEAGPRAFNRFVGNQRRFVAVDAGRGVFDDAAFADHFGTKRLSPDVPRRGSQSLPRLWGQSLVCRADHRRMRLLRLGVADRGERRARAGFGLGGLSWFTRRRGDAEGEEVLRSRRGAEQEREAPRCRLRPRRRRFCLRGKGAARHSPVRGA